MKKGFTLVELLAVIVILAIILAIAIPSISNMIENSQINALRSDMKMMVKAAKTYIGVNDSLLPKNVGDTKEISLENLQSSGYISTIKSPTNKSKTCNGYVLINKIDKDKYDYEPILNCENDIGNATEDSLIAYYSFDDKKESTANVIANTDLSTGWSKDYLTNIVYDEIAPPLGINSPIIGFTRGKEDGYLYSYGDYAEQDPGVVYTVSLYVKTMDSNFRIRFYTADNAEVGRYYSEEITVPNDGEWHRVVWKSFTNPSDSTSDSLSFKFNFNGAIGNSSTRTWFCAPQMEAKDYATDFVTGSRVDNVMDYSINNNNGILVIGNTPKWTNESAAGNGAYYFDGINDYISLPTSLSATLNNSSFTLSSWVKSSGLASGMILSGIISLNYGLNFDISKNNNLLVRLYNGTSIVGYESSGVNLNDDKWHYVATTFDGTNVSLYIDGKLNKKEPAIWNNQYNNIGTIGYDTNNQQTYRFYGLIDEVKIYKRALSQEEIKQEYNVAKDN